METRSSILENPRPAARLLLALLALLFSTGCGASAVPGSRQPPPRDSGGLLAAMKRSNEVESDHRNIMTPEFRRFCIASREHILLVIASAGLASAAMMGMLLVATVGLANAMEHGDPRSLRSWRTWLLPATLLAPGDAQLGGLPAAAAAVARANGPRVAHDFPPILRRLWLYHSIISVGTAAFLLPLGMLFEATSRHATTRRRLLSAFTRWLAAAAAAFLVWQAAYWRFGFLRAMGLYRPFSADGATIRYSVHYVTSTFGLLPVVLATLPRGTWALFGWLRSCVGQQQEIARSARQRYVRLERERARAERHLELAIGSWKWEQFHDLGDGQALGGLGGPDPEPAAVPDARGRSSAVNLPPAHPGLARRADARPYQTVAGSRPRVASRRPHVRDVLFPAPSTNRLRSKSPETEAPLARPSTEEDGAMSPHSPILYYSSSASSSDNDGDGEGAAGGDPRIHRVVRSARKRLWRQRERDMLELSRRIKKYHAHLLFIREEMARIDSSGVLDAAGSECAAAAAAAADGGTTAGPSGLAPLLLAAAQRALSLLTMSVATLCWLLLVLQVGRGALSAIFVGEPDLTHSFTYFIPALSAAGPEASSPADPPEGPATRAARLDETGARGSDMLPLLPPLVTACQAAAGVLLFVVVLFGLLSVGSSVEDSVHPLRLFATVYAERVLQARQWEWLPRVLLHADLLAAIDPTAVIPRLVAGAPPMRVAGRTSRAFFSSSADLTSYYRQLQRQGAASSPGAQLPDGVLPDSLLQAKALGRRVFLPLRRGSRRAVPMRQMLAYAWVVCGLAMSWPSVLRTTGLISERAYILPIASLVEPLWSPYVFDEEVVLQPARRPDAPETVPIVDPPPAGALEVCLVPTLNPTCGVGNGPSSGHPPPWDAQTSRHCPSLPLGQTAECAVVVKATSHAVLSTTATGGMAAAPAPEHRVSRRLLHLSLASDTLPRLLVRWLIRLGAAISPHVAVSLGFTAWWLDPDLIAPLSAAAVDLQLGFAPQARAPPPPPAASFGAAPALSEWYGMLRRLERRAIRLPHADDGTPLVLPQAGQSAEPHADSSASDDNGDSEAAGVPAWPMSGAAWDAARAAAAYVLDCVGAALQWLRQAVAVWAGRMARAAAVGARDKAAGTALEPVVRAVAGVASASADAALLAWAVAGRPLWEQLLHSAAAVLKCVARLDSLFAHAAAGAGWISRGFLAGDGLAPAAGADLGSAVPTVFLPAYWDAVAAHRDPALQRLRPELWPHALGAGAAGRALIFSPAPGPPPAQPPNASAAGSTGARGRPPASAATAPLQPMPEHGRLASAAWTAKGLLLAAYRVLLGLLACRAVFGPSRSPRPLVF
ncbi:hypothetical protein LPJ61_001665 [Coemansia biformis]|uniref:TMC domain-containing protein n=1 Tax=Coemansia biformis TaxID=1286918 RepID=A0A9W7Y9M2_9FUNG|nr:hypothetical protein LPJ61_001665 [Coemansia biformis]